MSHGMAGNTAPQQRAPDSNSDRHECALHGKMRSVSGLTKDPQDQTKWVCSWNHPCKRGGANGGEPRDDRDDRDHHRHYNAGRQHNAGYGGGAPRQHPNSAPYGGRGGGGGGGGRGGRGASPAPYPAPMPYMMPPPGYPPWPSAPPPGYAMGPQTQGPQGTDVMYCNMHGKLRSPANLMYHTRARKWICKTSAQCKSSEQLNEIERRRREEGQQQRSPVDHEDLAPQHSTKERHLCSVHGKERTVDNLSHDTTSTTWWCKPDHLCKGGK